MHVVSFVTQKGGSGKSTTAASVAVAAFQQGRRVFMLELDRQGLKFWLYSDFGGVEAKRDSRTIKTRGHALPC